MNEQSTVDKTQPIPSSITAKAADYIFELFKEKLPSELVYHNYRHTTEVVQAARKIGGAEGLAPEELEIVELACWFHDAGFTIKAKGHEEESVRIAHAFLSKEGYPDTKIAKVEGCILATKMPQNPTNAIEAVVCDADLSHIGKKEFAERSALLRVELEHTSGEVLSDFEWMKYNLDFLTGHTFHTKYAQRKYSERKAENLIELQEEFRQKVEKREAKEAKKQKKEEKKARKRKKPDRGIETVFRITSRNHIDLSAIADSKANTMLSINALIISIVVSLVMSKIEEFPMLAIPTFVLLGVCVLTIIFATIATRPKVTSGTVTKEAIKERKANLLFFGNFYNMTLEDYEWGMQELLEDREFLYGSLVKDLYYLGIVLGKKYRYLRLCYDVFMYGMVLSVA